MNGYCVFTSNVMECIDCHFIFHKCDLNAEPNWGTPTGTLSSILRKYSALLKGKKE